MARIEGPEPICNRDWTSRCGAGEHDYTQFGKLVRASTGSFNASHLHIRHHSDPTGFNMVCRYGCFLAASVLSKAERRWAIFCRDCCSPPTHWWKISGRPLTSGRVFLNRPAWMTSITSTLSFK